MKESVIRELRAVPRYSVNLPVCVTFRAAGAPQSSLNAFTRDISTRGMFVVANARPAEGDLLQFEIDLALDQASPLVVVQGEGRVVRTERPADQPAGFAVHNLWFRLREPEEGPALPLDLQAFTAKPAPARVSVRKPDRHKGLAIVPPQLQKDTDQGES